MLDGYARCLRFTEKPSLELAQEYVQAGDYLWNAGMFAFTVSSFQQALRQFAPEVAERMEQGYDVALACFCRFAVHLHRLRDNGEGGQCRRRPNGPHVE